MSSSATIGHIERVTFKSNLAMARAASSTNATGGALGVEGSVSRLRNSTFVGNRVVGGTDNDPADPGGDAKGGAVGLSGGSMGTIHANTFVDNEAQGGFGAAGSGLGLGGAIFNNNTTPMDVSGNLMTGNRTLEFDGTVTFEDCRDDGPGLVSGGWNREQAAGNCSFATTGRAIRRCGRFSSLFDLPPNFLGAGLVRNLRNAEPRFPQIFRPGEVLKEV